MDLKSYLVILKGNIRVILTTVLMTVAVVTILTFIITPIYTASTILRVATASSGSVGYSDYMYADRLMNTYIKLATSRPVLEELKGDLNLQMVPPIKVELIPNTELIRITVESSDPNIAKNAANALAEIIIAKGKELYSGGGKSTQEILGEQLKQAETELKQARQEYDVYLTQSPVDTERTAAMNEAIQLKERTYTTLLDQYDQARLRESLRANLISVVEPAILPLSPSKPNKVMNIGLGFIVGLSGGVGLAFLFESLGSRLYTSKQIEAVAELNPIGKIPALPRRNLFSLMKHDEDHYNSPFKEAFRRLQIQIFKQNTDGKTLRTLLITSSEPGEGKSLITTNLAISMAQSGRKVIVVDCDLRIPMQHKINGLSNKVGLSTVLDQPCEIKKAVRKTRYQGMYVLTSGPLPPDPMNILGSAQMKTLIDELLLQYDIVLLDSPALLVVADAALLASIADGVILVVRRNFIREEAVKETCRMLVDMNAPTIGMVINDAERNGSYYYYR